MEKFVFPMEKQISYTRKWAPYQQITDLEIV